MIRRAFVPAPQLALAVLLAAVLGGCTLKDETNAPPDVAAPPADALKTPSGLASKVLRVGLGSIHPTPRSSVTVHYTGWKTDGLIFDSSVKRGEPITFSLDRVISGWTEGLQLMVVGEKRRFWIPGNLVYDALPDPRNENPHGMLVFDIELLDVK